MVKLVVLVTTVVLKLEVLHNSVKDPKGGKIALYMPSKISKNTVCIAHGGTFDIKLFEFGYLTSKCDKYDESNVAQSSKKEKKSYKPNVCINSRRLDIRKDGESRVECLSCGKVYIAGGKYGTSSISGHIKVCFDINEMTKEIEAAIHFREVKRARTHFRFLVKWVGRPDYENSWIRQVQIEDFNHFRRTFGFAFGKKFLLRTAASNKVGLGVLEAWVLRNRPYDAYQPFYCCRRHERLA
ncbi:hypothetical protein M9H77_18644 [Catharanthus roseus]|uniref:Uncharacterized protein n=1 Tax=Catharanthus roseus TaxID=4058 RepID=A0ACC0B804_CATRO|nr:hypothetical protein M9H77_18644 [Catharanthus roseus]